MSPNVAGTMLRNHVSDLIHASVVLIVVIVSTIYAITSNDHSSNIWIVYGSAIAFAAGRAGAAIARNVGTRSDDPSGHQIGTSDGT